MAALAAGPPGPLLGALGLPASRLPRARGTLALGHQSVRARQRRSQAPLWLVGLAATIPSLSLGKAACRVARKSSNSPAGAAP